MPEGDTVLRTARRLQLALAGRVLTVSDFRWPSLATVDLRGRPVESVDAAGKHLLIRVTDNQDEKHDITIHSHLRMEGSWHVHRTGERWGNPRNERDIRLVLANEKWTAIGHKLGVLDLVRTSNEHEVVGHLGLDILKPEWNLGEATEQVRAHPGRAIGETLLDQRVVAGIGTFFMAESCFLRGVNPWTAGAAVDVGPLLEMAHRLMSASFENGLQVTTGNARRGQEQWVHSRSGRPCRRCGTTIRVARICPAPNDRVAFWCPHCQPGEVPTDTGAPQRPLGAKTGPKTGARTGPKTRYRRP